jgi:acylglycerol lipase
MESAI